MKLPEKSTTAVRTTGAIVEVIVTVEDGKDTMMVMQSDNGHPLGKNL